MIESFFYLYKRSAILALFITVGGLVRAQNANFTFVDDICINENLSLTNTSSGATNYNWNFCPYVFENTLDTELSTTISGANRTLGVDFIEVSNMWYALVTSWSNSRVYKLTFGDGLDQPPTQTDDLGNPSSLLNNPTSVGLVEQSGEIYALIHNWGSESLVKIHFTNGIDQNDVTISNVYSPYGQDRAKMVVINTATELKTILTDARDDEIEVIDFNNDINSTIDASDVLLTGAITGITDPRSIDVVEDAGNWYAFLGSRTNGEIIRVDFGSDFMTGVKNVQQDAITNVVGGNSLNNFDIIKVAGVYELHASTEQGTLHKVKIGNDITVSGISTGAVNYASSVTYQQGYGLKIIEENMTINGFIFNDISEQLYRIFDTKPCFSSTETSPDFEPEVSFSQDGTYPIVLTASDASGNSDFLTKDLTVTANVGPVIDFSVGPNQCLTQPLNFTGTSDIGISSWSWDFGDTNTDTGQNVSHTYGSSGIYTVKLGVVASNGCTNSITKQVEVFDPPPVSFSIDAGVNTCSNEIINFMNTTPGSTGATFLWNFGDGATSMQENPSHIYSTDNSFNVTLTVDLAGCQGSDNTMLNVASGPLIEFEADTVFSESPTSFQNFTTGSTITGYSWNFGDGNVSTDIHPTNSYVTDGIKDVTLDVNTNNGCDGTIQKNVLVLERPNIYFAVDDPFCNSQNIPLDSVIISNTIESFEWNFCSEQFTDPLIVEESAVINQGGRNLGISFIKDDNGLWYGFATSWSNNSLFRMEFSNGIDQDPTFIEDLGNPGGLLDQPVSIGLVSQNSNIYAVIHNWGSQSLVRIRFEGGASVDTFNATSIYSPIGANQSKMEVIQTPQQIVAAIISEDGTLDIVDFNNDIENAITSSDVLTELVGGVSNPRELEIVRDSGNWYMFLANWSSGTITRVDFGDDLFNGIQNVELDVIDNLYAGQRPNNIEVLKKSEVYEVHVLTTEGSIYRVRIGNDITENISSGVIQYGSSFTFNQGYSMNFVKEGGRYVGFVLSDIAQQIYRIENNTDCFASTATSTSTSPTVNYSQTGTYNVTLEGVDSQGNVHSITKSLNVSTNTAPDIDFSSSFPISCVNNTIDFTSINNSADIQFYNWDFGDGTTSTLENPSHAFTTPGTYEVILSVTDANPCDNFVRKSISIYEDPVGTFDSPGGLTCTNQPITFTNTTPDNFEGNETFEWQVDGNIVSTDRDLDYEFLSGGTFEIKLTTSIPGCSNQTIDNFDVVAGPTPDFTVTDNCVGTQFQFVNTTTGSNITSYTWDFDNGFMSTDQNPQPFEYSQPGIYNVTLTTINAAGCETSIEKSLTVYDLPQVSFTNDLSCEGAPTQFNDISVVANANIESWTWDFDDASSGSNSSIEQNPSHTFTSSGQFDVQLIATTTFGCIDSVEQTLNVKSGPQADFSFNRVCLGEEIQFTDESLPVPGEVITSWGWDLGGEFSDNQNPATSFDFAIDYNVNLTVTSQNLCTNTVEKTISVNPVPDVNFEMENACSNEIVHFYDVTEAVGDPVDTRSWTFDDLGNASDSSVTFDFSNSGSYEVTLDITTQGGCEYQTTEAIAINQPPKASFEVNSAFGAPPFNVQFMNTSEGATTYSWSFGDQTNSTEANPQHTFEAEGSYDVELVAIDDTGCSDTTNLVMNALDPDLEIELLQVTFVNDKLILTIINNGTLIVDSLKAVVNLGDQLVLEETINRQLLPSTNPAAINHTLSLNLASRKIEYLCVTLESFIEGIDDSNDVNNTKCKNFESQIVFVNPFPNPAKGVLNINVLSEISGAGSIRLISSLGKTVETTSFDGVRGKNEIAMDVSHIKNGIYLLEVGMAGQNFTTRVAINN